MIFFKIDIGSDLVVRGGVEPPTFRFSGGRSCQLSYLTLPGSGRASATTRGLEPRRPERS